MAEQRPEPSKDNTESDEELENFTTRLPADLRQAVRLEAVTQKRSVQDVVTEALREWLGNQHK